MQGNVIDHSHKHALSHGEKIVLRDVDLTIERGEIVTVVGPNGS
jgi:ABC-type cobalamin/Fe3+-siderophores transport system ATPase subunit